MRQDAPRGSRAKRIAESQGMGEELGFSPIFIGESSKFREGRRDARDRIGYGDRLRRPKLMGSCRTGQGLVDTI
jgi:hypothetical protein